MLFKINSFFGGAPSRTLNKMTLGNYGQNLCGRVYLYQNYVSKKNVAANLFRVVIDWIEPGHCETAARRWRVRLRSEGLPYPRPEYVEYFTKVRPSGSKLND